MLVRLGENPCRTAIRRQNKGLGIVQIIYIYIYNQIRLPEHIHHVGHRASSCQGNYCMQVVDQLCHEFEREVSQMTQDALKNQDLG